MSLDWPSRLCVRLELGGSALPVLCSSSLPRIIVPVGGSLSLLSCCLPVLDYPLFASLVRLPRGCRRPLTFSILASSCGGSSRSSLSCSVFCHVCSPASMASTFGSRLLISCPFLPPIGGSSSFCMPSAWYLSGGSSLLIWSPRCKSPV